MPLPKKVIENHAVDANEERYTGYIDLRLKCRTPLALGKSDIFQDNAYFIPGSSIRGMVRTIVEIMSCGKFIAGESFEDRKLHFVARNGKKILARRGAGQVTRNIKICFAAGYITCRDGKFVLIPAIQVDRQSYCQIDDDANADPDRVIRFSTKEKQVTKWLVNAPNSDINLQLAENDVKEYKEYFTYAKKYLKYEDTMNLLDNASKRQKIKNMVPCFFARWKDQENRERISIGSHEKFGILYHKGIKDIIPENLQRVEMVDIPEALFGKKAYRSGRVYFEDCKLQKSIQTPEESNLTLMSPHPEAHKKYSKDEKDWEDNQAEICGYKQYLHQQVKVPTDTKYNVGEIITQVIVIEKNQEFAGRICFNALSAIELGALFTALEMPEHCYHKIGAGKSYGYGSVKLSLSKVQIIDERKRYGKLFNSRCWVAGMQDAPVNAFEKVFQEYIAKNIGKEGDVFSTLEHVKRLYDNLRWCDDDD